MKALSLNNTEKAFKNKSDSQLKHSYLIFRLMKNPALISFLKYATLIALKIKLPVSSIIKHTVFRQFCGGENINECELVIKKLSQNKIGSILDYSVEGKEKNEDFESTKNEIIRIIQVAKYDKGIPFTCLKMTGIMKFSLLEKNNNKQQMNEAEKKDFAQSGSRLNDICFYSCFNAVPLFIDAEESWIQDTIDEMAETMMRAYNKEKPIVLTTLQMYRWDRIEYLNKLIEIGKKENFYLGIKLVRGAYWEKENKRAAELRYQSPVHNDKEATDKDFDLAVSICLKNIDRILLCVGTHNEESTLFLVNKMKELGLPNNHPHVYFSQLYGMSDHISYNLADEGYNVTKYLPYGPVKTVIPYLIRRAEENTSIAGQMGRELKLITDEKKRRKF